MNRLLMSIAFALALPASAHEGHHEQMPLTEALRHLVSQPDHQIAFAALDAAFPRGPRPRSLPML